MNFFHRHHLIGLSKHPSLKHSTVCHNLNQSLASIAVPLDTHFLKNPHSSSSAKAISIRLSTCANLQQLDQIYACIIRTRMPEFCLAPFYWNNVLRLYTRLGDPVKVLRVYAFMPRAGVLPDSYTIPIVLKAACQLFAIDIGVQLHSVAIRIGLEADKYCESGFISLYAKLGEIENAYKVFEKSPERKLSSWNAIIAGLRLGGRAKEVIKMFIQMRQWGFEPDDVTILCVTSACGSIGDLNLALQLHKYVFHARTLRKPDILMLNSLIDMYGKCGRMDLALRVFLEMTQKNVSSWTSMIVGYAMHGQANEAIECFHCMIKTGVRPNDVTFVGVLSACVHCGKVQEGRYYFDMMKSVYGIVPQMKHYGCIVDLLARVGLLEEARELVEGMPMKANVIIWGSLMGACEKYGNVKMGEWVARNMLELEPWNDGVYVVLSNIYASKGLWQEVEMMRKHWKQQNRAKIHAYSLATSSKGSP
uniref:Uncharacterized protein MANES_03G025700 n=1 Tax=Rhizophora mucronata TaxID=61149 RepID=A0A2P2MZ14_RHIMU